MFFSVGTVPWADELQPDLDPSSREFQRWHIDDLLLVSRQDQVAERICWVKACAGVDVVRMEIVTIYSPLGCPPCQASSREAASSFRSAATRERTGPKARALDNA